MRGERDDRTGESLAAKTAGGSIPIQFGHLHVHQYEIELAGKRLLNRDAAVLGDHDFHARLSQHGGDESLIVYPVLGEEYSGRYPLEYRFRSRLRHHQRVLKTAALS